VENSDAHAPRHSGVCGLCNLSLLDYATQRLLVDRPLKLGQLRDELFIVGFPPWKHSPASRRRRRRGFILRAIQGRLGFRVKVVVDRYPKIECQPESVSARA
jgi:hypothetical protein